MAQNMGPINDYRRRNPAARSWPHMTRRSLDGVRGAKVSEIRVLEPMILTDQMITILYPALSGAQVRRAAREQ
ncbi:hypothetical protein [Prescottella equi]|uniref:hypothetical protein n=1 Tax=Rhodococcus hoagii TaxID=43767 RepID=UPI0012FCB55A|nr:hypothetical protein [Prescottella equi]